MKNIIFIVVVASVVILLYVLSREVVVPLPSDDSHQGITEKERCLDCHGDGMEFPKGKDHPPKDQCFKCHKPERP